MLKIALCDDDLRFTGYFENLIKQEAAHLGVDVETEIYSDGDTLIRSIEGKEQYDIIFLDIEMNRIDGISTARKIREWDRMVLLIYVSGYEQYLIELFEVEPFRFLLKPLDTNIFSRYFQDACQKIREVNVYYQFTFNREIHKVPIRDIMYFESQNRIVNILLADGTCEQFYGKLNDVETELLDGKMGFLRIHQSFLVNYEYIKKMNFTSLVLSKGKKEEIILKISEERQKSVRTQLCKIASKKIVVQRVEDK